MLGRVLQAAGRALSRYLSQPSKSYVPLASSPFDRLARVIRPGDVLLVEGNTRVSTAIKYLTQSTWSHAALYVGAVPGLRGGEGDGPLLIEADLVQGVCAVPLDKYAGCHTRICRPVGLQPADLERVIEFAISQLGFSYDLKNIIDLARYLLPTPPVPTRWRRRMLALGSGDPTRAICSTLIAQAFQRVGYPILPLISRRPSPTPDCNTCYDEIFRIRHHSLYAPRDFDISPYFQVVKPTLESRFDYRQIVWDEEGDETLLLAAKAG